MVLFLIIANATLQLTTPEALPTLDITGVTLKAIDSTYSTAAYLQPCVHSNITLRSLLAIISACPKPHFAVLPHYAIPDTT